MKNRFLYLFLAIVAAGAFSCAKDTEYVPVPYACECGSLKWQGTSYQLLDANYILADSTEALSRQYYITADVQLEGEELTHSVNMTLVVDDVSEVLLFIDEDDAEFAAQVDELNLNDPILTLRQYVPVDGSTIQISPAIFGGTETVTFNLALMEVYNGTPVGQPIPFSGSFKVRVVV